jgi:glycosyltransferase involved in cell wall biosynthesis
VPKKFKSNMNPRVSIIIPCYNQGRFLRETLESVQNCPRDLYEVVIVNDGSTDQYTNDYIDELKQNGYIVIEQENKGLAAARNAAIHASRGEFILPLDSDNRIKADYLTNGIAIMESDLSIAVVYGNAEYFGGRQGVWNPGKFNLQRLMLSNYIDACALVRRSVLERVGYYDTGMKYMGWEDWDIWLRIAFAGYKFYHLEKVVWDYRVADNSMSKQVYNSYEKPNHLEKYVNDKYPQYMGHDYIIEHFIKRLKASPIKFMQKLIIRAYFPNFYNKLLSKNKIRRGI